MNLLITAALALNVLAASPPLAGPDLDRALGNYRAIIAGRIQLVDLPLRDKREVIELDRWLRGPGGIAASETKQECKDRLASASPSPLEEALLDLKCSQRPSER